ncbi:hypothetical protein FSP39_018400 [Pinctada imbricata]|uniref:Peptidase S1 domain-containing protein n=1 Tax=Pinctada imbricata TaxID=66713 RepID=A0AA89BL23_PINIB|nr:hypothetical protein FSP39_018400 [Pinctada imbricata]
MMGCRYPMSSRIVNGENADINDHPHQASIRYQYWSNHICGASLIHESGWFVTAAHCVDETSPQMYGIRVGSSEISSGIDYTVLKIIKHSGYNGAASGIPNDIALIQVNGPVDTSPRGVDKIELATGSYTGTYCTITGWGATYGGGPLTIEHQIEHRRTPSKPEVGPGAREE